MFGKLGSTLQSSWCYWALFGGDFLYSLQKEGFFFFFPQVKVSAFIWLELEIARERRWELSSWRQRCRELCTWSYERTFQYPVPGLGLACLHTELIPIGFVWATVTLQGSFPVHNRSILQRCVSIARLLSFTPWTKLNMGKGLCWYWGMVFIKVT